MEVRPSLASSNLIEGIYWRVIEALFKSNYLSSTGVFRFVRAEDFGGQKKTEMAKLLSEFIGEISTLNFVIRDPVHNVDIIAGFAQRKALFRMQKVFVFKWL